MNKRVRIAILTIALAVMLVSGYKLYETLHDYRVADSAYGDTADLYVKRKSSADFEDKNLQAADIVKAPEDEAEIGADNAYPEKEEEKLNYSAEGAYDWSGYADPAPIEVDFETLLQENGDFKGWLYCENTPINYPVMQGASNETYLHHLPDGTYNFSGSLFIEQNNSPDLSDVNTIIYGHSMKNGSMFGSIINYAKQKYYDEHTVLWYLTPYGDFRLDPVIGFTIPADAELYDAYYDIESYREILDKYAGKSTFESGIEIDKLDQVIMLSTCSHAYDDARYVLICRLVPCIPDWALTVGAYE